MDVSFQTQEGRFNLRVSGLLIHENRLLIMKDEQTPYYYIPGGRIALNETAETAIVREFQEELHVNASIERMVFVGESFFTEEVNKEDYHEICMYYLMNVEKSSYIYEDNQFLCDEDGTRCLTFTWMPIEELKNQYIYPVFIKEKIMNLPEQIEYVIEIRK